MQVDTNTRLIHHLQMVATRRFSTDFSTSSTIATETVKGLVRSPSPSSQRRGANRHSPKLVKKVRFHLNEDGSVPETAMVEPKRRYLHDKKETWYTSCEMDSIDDSSYSIVSFYTNCCPNYRRSLTELLTGCSASGANLNCLRMATFSVSDVVDTSARGLEQHIVPLLRQRQKRSVELVLNLQKRMQKNVSEDVRARMLAQQYERNSNYASLWARIIAEGDAMAIAKDI